jgi:hypothetical protein
MMYKNYHDSRKVVVCSAYNSADPPPSIEMAEVSLSLSFSSSQESSWFFL